MRPLRAVAAVLVPALVVLAFLGHAGSSHATEKYALICNVTNTYDPEGRKSATSGETTFVVEDRQDGAQIVSIIGGFCDTFTDYRVSDSSFYLTCETKMGEQIAKTTYVINRYSGKFDKMFSLSHQPGTFRHTGECRKAEKRF